MERTASVPRALKSPRTARSKDNTLVQAGEATLSGGFEIPVSSKWAGNKKSPDKTRLSVTSLNRQLADGGA